MFFFSLKINGCRAVPVSRRDRVSSGGFCFLTGLDWPVLTTVLRQASQPLPSPSCLDFPSDFSWAASLLSGSSTFSGQGWNLCCLPVLLLSLAFVALLYELAP